LGRTTHARLPRDNLGCVGASYGGYSVYMLAGIHEGRFKSFISHCGLFDLESWYLTTEEMFFANFDLGGPFWEEKNARTYSLFDPKDYVQNWNTPMLVIHGGKDFRVPENQGMEAFQAAKLRGVPTRFLYFPTEGHWIQSPQNGFARSIFWLVGSILKVSQAQYNTIQYKDLSPSKYWGFSFYNH
jgi:dipeptidyl aminopeptidase/acylaminoacyl peptidase